jgi:hypothetical protein
MPPAIYSKLVVEQGPEKVTKLVEKSTGPCE